VPAAGPGGDRPRGVSERQGWLPPALRAVSLLMLDRAWRSERMTERSAVALAWHASLSRPVWRRPAATTGGLLSAPGPAARLQAPPFPEASQPGTASAPAAFHPAPHDVPPRVARAPRGGGGSPFRPPGPLAGPAGGAERRGPPRGQDAGGRLAGLPGIPSRPTGRPADSPAGPWPPVPAATWRAAAPSAGPWPPVPAPPTRPARGGTEPWRPAPPAAAGPGGGELGVHDHGHRGQDQPAPTPRFPPRMDGHAAPPAVAPLPGQGGLLGRLLDGVVEPVALPGLAIRPARPAELPDAGLARPAEPPLARPTWEDAAPWTGRRDAPGAEGANEIGPRAPDPRPTPAEPDVDAVTEQVYQRLLRRQRLERERRGWY
jgi:hypothetical protein